MKSLDTLLEYAAKLQAALVTQDIEEMERLSVRDECPVTPLGATAGNPAVWPVGEVVRDLAAQLRSIHAANAAIVRSRIIYLNALRALLDRSATYGTNGIVPHRARSTTSLKA